MRVDELDYDLPPQLIAQQPPPRRSDARMMVLHRRQRRWEHRSFRDLPGYLAAGDLLVLNDTRVLPTRLLGRKVLSGGKVELTLVRREAPGLWEAHVHGRKAPAGTRLELRSWQDRAAGPTVEILEERPSGTRLVRVPDEALARFGRLPLPPYVKRELEDQERYQTVYARQPGAVAAPTAGLHFDRQMLQRVREAGIETTTVTLHVGPDSFRPIAAERVEDHRLASEWCRLPPETAERIRAARRVVAVGTTSVRTLETAARHGSVQPFQGPTELFIHPGFEFRVVDLLLTNFHLPRSTLLALVSAFVQAALPGGESGLAFLLEAYRQAVRERYRFYSLGDCMLLL